MTRSLLLLAAIAAFVAGTKLVVEDALGLGLEPMVVAWVTSPGAGSAALIAGLLAADVFLPVPSSIVMVLSGAVFGVLWGSALALAGSISGEWLGFELVRRYGRRVSGRIAGDEELLAVNRFFERYGVLAIIVTRPLPVVMETMSMVAGLSRMPRRVFLGASIAGTAPIVVVYAWAGALSRAIGSVVPAIVILVTVAAAAWFWYRSHVTSISPPPSPSSAASPGSRPADRTPSPGCHS